MLVQLNLLETIQQLTSDFASECAIVVGAIWRTVNEPHLLK